MVTEFWKCHTLCGVVCVYMYGKNDTLYSWAGIMLSQAIFSFLTSFLKKCNTKIQWFHLTFSLLVSSADSLGKQIGPRSGQTKRLAWSGSNLFDTQMVFLKEFFKNVDFDKNNNKTADDKKAWKITQGAKS